MQGRQLPPQSTSVSSWFLIASVQVASRQRLRAQKLLSQSRFAVHRSFVEQRAHLLVPPQSTSDSLESLLLFSQGASVTPAPPSLFAAPPPETAALPPSA